MPSKKRKYNARFPAGRIKKIMQTDEEVGKVAQAVPIIISRTLELFVESLLKKSMSVTVSRNAKTLSPSHVKQCILSESRFDFLRDLVKNIPDVSAAEEREQNLQSDNISPTAIRYTETVTPQTTTKTQPQSSLPSTSKSVHHQIKTVQSESTVTGCTVEHNGRRSTSNHENSVMQRVDGNPKPEDLSRRRLPNFYQETLHDSDSNHEPTASQYSVIQYAGAPEATKINHSENKPKIDLVETYAAATPLFRVDLSRAPLRSSLSFESSLQPRPQPLVKYGFGAGSPSPIQRSASLVQARAKQPPALVPIAPSLGQDVDEDYDT